MSNFSSGSPKHHGCSPVSLVPPNDQMTSLTVEDNKTSNRPRSPDSRFTIQTGKFSADSSMPHGCSPISVAPPTEQATSLAVEDKTSNTNSSSGSSDANSPTFFQLLETVSPHVQSVLLNKCNVLELSSLAVFTSQRSLSPMAKRSLVVRFVTNLDVTGVLGQFVFRSETMHIDDCSDPSRNVIIEIGNEYPCFSWRKVQRLLYFCGHAVVKSIDYQIDPFDSPEYDAVRAGHCTRTEWSLEEFFVDEFYSFSYNCFDMLKFVSPRTVTLILFDKELKSDDVIVHARLHSVLHSRGVLSADSILINFVNQPIDYVAVTDSLMLSMAASTIRFSTFDGVSSVSTCPKCIHWSPMGVSLFIEQWLRGSRVIKHVQSCLPMGRDLTDPPSGREAVEFGENLVEALGKLEQPPLIQFSTSLTDELENQLQTGDDINDVGFCSDASIVRVRASDRRELTVVVNKAFEIWHNRSTEVGFIHMFPWI